MKSYRFRLFPLSPLSGMFSPEKLGSAIDAGSKEGYRLVRREFTIEPRRFLFFLKALAFGLVFTREEAAPSDDYTYKVAVYRTRFFTKTIDRKAFEKTLNKGAEGGHEMFFSIKYPTRFLFFFPRESYMMIFRRPTAGTQKSFSYSLLISPYRYFTRTIEETRYEGDLNAAAATGGTFKVSFRDERRLFGMFRQPTVVAIMEDVS